jgi:ABC-type polysaccharide/polyol phosphate transport system ATPase subunit
MSTGSSLPTMAELPTDVPEPEAAAPDPAKAEPTGAEPAASAQTPPDAVSSEPIAPEPLPDIGTWLPAAATGPVCVSFENVGLKFRKYGGGGSGPGSPPGSLKQAILDRFFRKNYRQHSEFWLYRDLNFTIRRGDRVGIIGHNGAGKSTLLRMICGIYRPSLGTISVTGRIAPLLELGAGFNPELSGLENIFLNGAVLGFSRREMERKVESILEFAGLRDHARVPVKYYSSGMQLRLAFSVATDTDPEILLIDVVFSAGDQDFQDRARRRMSHLIDASHCMAFVSHAIPHVKQYCNRAIWIDHGRIAKSGTVDEVCEAYQNSTPTQI